MEFWVIVAAMTINRLWYAVPLIATVSLVLAATRHERMGLIFRHAARTAVWIGGFVLVLFVVLWLVSEWL